MCVCEWMFLWEEILKQKLWAEEPRRHLRMFSPNKSVSQTWNKNAKVKSNRTKVKQNEWTLTPEKSSQSKRPVSQLKRKILEIQMKEVLIKRVHYMIYKYISISVSSENSWGWCFLFAWGIISPNLLFCPHISDKMPPHFRQNGRPPPPSGHLSGPGTLLAFLPATLHFT